MNYLLNTEKYWFNIGLTVDISTKNSHIKPSRLSFETETVGER